MNELCFLSGLTSGEWASWVQAVGSVAAICVSAVVVVWQVRKQHSLATKHARDTAFEDELQDLLAFLGIVEKADAALQNGVDTLTGVLPLSTIHAWFEQSPLPRLQVALKALDISKVTNAEVVLSILETRDAFDALKYGVEQAISLIPNHPTGAANAGTHQAQRLLAMASATAPLRKRADWLAQQLGPQQGSHAASRSALGSA